MKKVDREVNGPSWKRQSLPIREIDPLQVAADSNRESRSDKLIQAASQLASSEALLLRDHALAIMLHAKVVDNFAKAERKLNSRAIAKGTFRGLELRRLGHIGRGAGLTSPVANLCGELKEPGISGQAIGSRRCTGERTGGHTVVVQEPLIRRVVRVCHFSTGNLLQETVLGLDIFHGVPPTKRRNRDHASRVFPARRLDGLDTFARCHGRLLTRCDGKSTFQLA